MSTPIVEGHWAWPNLVPTAPNPPTFLVALKLVYICLSHNYYIGAACPEMCLQVPPKFWRAQSCGHILGHGAPGTVGSKEAMGGLGPIEILPPCGPIEVHDGRFGSARRYSSVTSS